MEELLSEEEYFMIFGDDDTALDLDMLLGFAAYDATKTYGKVGSQKNGGSGTTTTTTIIKPSPVTNPAQKSSTPSTKRRDNIKSLLNERFTSPHRDGITRREFFLEISENTKNISAALSHLLPEYLSQFITSRLNNIRLVTERIQFILINLQHAKFNVLRLLYTIYSMSIAIKNIRLIQLSALLYHITSYIYTILVMKYQHVILVLKWYDIMLSLEQETLENSLEKIQNEKNNF
jgi:hypothetical protein